MECEYSLNKVIYKAGDSPDFIYFIKEGQIEVTISCCSLLLVINESQFDRRS